MAQHAQHGTDDAWAENTDGRGLSLYAYRRFDNNIQRIYVLSLPIYLFTAGTFSYNQYYLFLKSVLPFSKISATDFYPLC